MPAGTYNWAYNLLSELAPNAILFSAGDNDTFLPWIIQEVKNHRQDVIVVNTSLILMDDYRKKLFSEVGVKPLGLKMLACKSAEEYQSNLKKIFDAIFNNEAGRPVYVAGTALRQFEEDYSGQLYLTGLAYKYCNYDFDNLSVIKRNVEKRYLLDALSEQFAFHPLDKKTQQCNSYYLPAFMKLYKHYLISEETLKAQDLRKLILKIAKDSPQHEDVMKWLKNN